MGAATCQIKVHHFCHAVFVHSTSSEITANTYLTQFCLKLFDFSCINSIMSMVEFKDALIVHIFEYIQIYSLIIFSNVYSSSVTCILNAQNSVAECSQSWSLQLEWDFKPISVLKRHYAHLEMSWQMKRNRLQAERDEIISFLGSCIKECIKLKEKIMLLRACHLHDLNYFKNEKSSPYGVNGSRSNILEANWRHTLLHATCQAWHSMILFNVLSFFGKLFIFIPLNLKVYSFIFCWFHWLIWQSS